MSINDASLRTADSTEVLQLLQAAKVNIGCTGSIYVSNISLAKCLDIIDQREAAPSEGLVKQLKVIHHTGIQERGRAYLLCRLFWMAIHAFVRWFSSAIDIAAKIKNIEAKISQKANLNPPETHVVGSSISTPTALPISREPSLPALPNISSFPPPPPQSLVETMHGSSSSSDSEGDCKGNSDFTSLKITVDPPPGMSPMPVATSQMTASTESYPTTSYEKYQFFKAQKEIRIALSQWAFPCQLERQKGTFVIVSSCAEFLKCLQEDLSSQDRPKAIFSVKTSEDRHLFNDQMLKSGGSICREYSWEFEECPLLDQFDPKYIQTLILHIVKSTDIKNTFYSILNYNFEKLSAGHVCENLQKLCLAKAHLNYLYDYLLTSKKLSQFLQIFRPLFMEHRRDFPVQQSNLQALRYVLEKVLITAKQQDKQDVIHNTLDFVILYGNGLALWSDSFFIFSDVAEFKAYIDHVCRVVESNPLPEQVMRSILQLIGQPGLTFSQLENIFNSFGPEMKESHIFAAAAPPQRTGGIWSDPIHKASYVTTEVFMWMRKNHLSTYKEPDNESFTRALIPSLCKKFKELSGENAANTSKSILFDTRRSLFIPQLVSMFYKWQIIALLEACLEQSRSSSSDKALFQQALVSLLTTIFSGKLSETMACTATQKLRQLLSYIELHKDKLPKEFDMALSYALKKLTLTKNWEIILSALGQIETTHKERLLKVCLLDITTLSHWDLEEITARNVAICNMWLKHPDMLLSFPISILNELMKQMEEATQKVLRQALVQRLKDFERTVTGTTSEPLFKEVLAALETT